MENTENTTEDTATEETQVTPEELANLFDSIQEARESVTAAEMEVEQAFQALISAAGKTFCFKGQWYQVRVRMSKALGREVSYLCELKGEPRTWLKGRPKGSKNGKAEGVADELLTEAEDVFIETEIAEGAAIVVE